MNRCLAQIAGTVCQGHDHGHAAVIDQAVVEQAQRLTNEPSIQIGVEVKGFAHHRLRVEAGMVSECHGNFSQLFGSGAVHGHVALPHQGMKSAWRGHAIGKPQASTPAAIVVALSTIACTGGFAIVAIDQGHGLGQTGLQNSRCGLDTDTAETTMAGGGQGVRRIDAAQLRKALVVGYAVEDQAVNVRKIQTGICQRILQGPQPQVIGIQFGHGGIAGIAHTDHTRAQMRRIHVGFKIDNGAGHRQPESRCP